MKIRFNNFSYFPYYSLFYNQLKINKNKYKQIKMQSKEIDIPKQYKYNNFIIIICNQFELYKNIFEYIKLREDGQLMEDIKLIRYMKPNNEKYIIENDESTTNIFEEFFDELNEEEYIKKCKYILNIDGTNLGKIIECFIEKYQKKIYFTEWNPEEYERVVSEDFQTNKNRRIKYLTTIQQKQNEENKISDQIKIIKEINEINHITSTEQEDNKINIVTYVRKIDNEFLNSLQFKCIIENYKNPAVKNIVVIGDGVEDSFKSIHYEKIDYKRIILVNDNDDNISFSDMLSIANELFNEQIVVILRSDIILLSDIELESLYLEYYIENKKVYCLTRIERDSQGRFIRIAPNQNLFGAIEQDAWIFKSPIVLNENNDKIRFIKEYDFYEKWSELYLNNYLLSEGYELINDNTSHKIIRITTQNDLRVREYIKPESKRLNKDDAVFLPEKSVINKITMDQWCNICQIDENEMYKWKMEMMNKSLKGKINMF